MVNILLTRIILLWLKIPMLISDLCDNSDACIVVKRIITVADANNAKKRNKKLAFKINASFR